MTRQLWHTKKTGSPRLGAICLTLLLFFSLVLMLRRADVVVDCMQKGIALCARTIIPSLFPFMVLSELLVSSGTGEWLAVPLERPLGKLLGLPRAGCCAVVLGLLCGFPIGARCAILAYKKGTLSREECERALACSSIPSSAFLISTVGSAMWQDTKFGVLLYISAVFSAILSGILLYVMQNKNRTNKRCKTAYPHAKIYFEAKMLPTAIKNATLNTLLICAYVVFFCTLTGAVEIVTNQFAASEVTHTIISILLELSGGVSAASKLDNRQLAALLTGAAVGWSGLSIHCQMLSLCDGYDISTQPYLTAKLLQAVLCVAMMGVVSCLFLK